MNDTEWLRTMAALASLHELQLKDMPYLPEIEHDEQMTKEELDAARDALMKRAEEFAFRDSPYIGKNGKRESSDTIEELPFKGIGALLNQPEEDTQWVWDRMLPTRGLSLLVAPPKAGKTTLVQCLTMAVARGVPFLGRETQTAPIRPVPCRPPGPILLLALEEKPSEVQRHYRQLGATEDDPIHVFVEPAPKDVGVKLANAVDRLKPVLVVIDPLFKFVRLRDSNDYIQVTEGMEVVLNMARRSGAHVLAVHHARKGGGGHGEESLGSTALLGAVDCALSLKRNDSKRTIYSINRYGEDMPESVLTMDENGWVSLAGTRAEIDRDDTAADILAFLEAQSEPVQQQGIIDGVTGTGKVVRDALRVLVDGNKIQRTGAGRRRDPFLYSRVSL